MIHSLTFRRHRQSALPFAFNKPIMQRSSVAVEKPDVPTAKVIAGFLIECAKTQVPTAVINNSTRLSGVVGLNVVKLANRFMAKNTWGFYRQDFALDAALSFIENAHQIHDLLVPSQGVKKEPAPSPAAAKHAVFEKQVQGTALRFQPQGSWNEKDLEEARAHLALSAAEVATFSTSKHPLHLTFISSKKIVGQVKKLRGGRTRKEDDRVDVRFAISRQGWQAPGAFVSALKSLGLACLWPLSAFAFRPNLSWEKGEVEKHFSYRLKAAE